LKVSSGLITLVTRLITVRDNKIHVDVGTYPNLGRVPLCSGNLTF